MLNGRLNSAVMRGFVDIGHRRHVANTIAVARLCREPKCELGCGNVVIGLAGRE